jgi:hypothetical protein
MIKEDLIIVQIFFRNHPKDRYIYFLRLYTVIFLLIALYSCIYSAQVSCFLLYNNNNKLIGI